jgi:hypothetical protein
MIEKKLKTFKFYKVQILMSINKVSFDSTVWLWFEFVPPKIHYRKLGLYCGGVARWWNL